MKFIIKLVTSIVNPASAIHGAREAQIAAAPIIEHRNGEQRTPAAEPNVLRAAKPNRQKTSRR